MAIPLRYLKAALPRRLFWACPKCAPSVGVLCDPTASTGDATALLRRCLRSFCAHIGDLHFSWTPWDPRENAALVCKGLSDNNPSWMVQRKGGGGISWSISTKVWDRAGIELANPGSAVRLASGARHVTDCATRPGKILWNKFLIFLVYTILQRVCAISFMIRKKHASGLNRSCFPNLTYGCHMFGNSLSIKHNNNCLITFNAFGKYKHYQP